MADTPIIEHGTKILVITPEGNISGIFAGVSIIEGLPFIGVSTGKNTRGLVSLNKVTSLSWEVEKEKAE